MLLSHGAALATALLMQQNSRLTIWPEITRAVLHAVT